MTHPELSGFPVVIEQPVAWADMDSFAHVNNVVYFRYFENARIAYLDRVGWFALMRDTGLGPIVGSTQARFRRAVTYPDRLLVGARITAVGADRVTFDHRIVSTAQDAVVTEGQAVVVSFDYRGGVKTALPETIRQQIVELEGG